MCHFSKVSLKMQASTQGVDADNELLYQSQSSKSMYILNKQLLKIVENIQDAHDKLLPLISNPNIFISSEQIKKLHLPTFQSIRESIETMQTFLRNQNTSINTEQQVANEKSRLFASLFHNFIEQALTLFSRGAFPINQLNPHVIQLANLHLMYFKMVKDPDYQVDKEFFLSTWNALNQLFLSMKGIIREIDFGCYPPQFDDMYRILLSPYNFYIQTDQRAIAIAKDTGEALDAIKRQLLYLNSVAEPTISILKDTKFILNHYIAEFEQFKDYVIQTRNLRPSDINTKAQINNQLKVIIDSAIAAFELIDTAASIENVIQSPGFVFYSGIFAERGLLSGVVQQSVDFITAEIRSLLTAGAKQDYATHLMQLVKGLSDSLKTGTLDADALKDFVKAISEYDPSSDQSERQIIQICEKSLNFYTQGRDQGQNIIAARNHLENFKHARDKRSSSAEIAYQKFWSLFLFYSIIGDANNQQLNDYIHKNLVVAAIVGHLHEVVPLIEDSIKEINKTPFQDAFHLSVTKQKTIVDKLIEIIDKWDLDIAGVSVKSQFIRILYSFLKFCSIVLTNAESQAMVEGVSLMLSYFPNPSVIRDALNLEEAVTAVSKQISKILGEFSITAETASETIQFPVATLDQKVESELNIQTEITFYEIRKLNTLTEEVVFMFKFVTLYERFFESFCPRNGYLCQLSSYKPMEAMEFNNYLGFITPFIHILGSKSVKTNLTTNLLKHILIFFSSVMLGDVQMVKTEIVNIVPLTPHIDFSEVTYKAISNIPNFYVHILVKVGNDQSKIEDWMDLLELYNLATTSLVASFVSGSVAEFKDEAELFLTSAESIDRELGSYFRVLYSDVHYFASHITAVHNLASAMEKALSDDLPQQIHSKEWQIAKLHNCFSLNMYLAFSIVAKDLAARGVLSESSYTDYENCLRIIANARSSAFDDIPERGFEYLKKFYFILRGQLYASATGCLESRGPSLMSKLAALIADTKEGISRDTAEVLKKMVSKLHAIKNDDNCWQQERKCCEMKDLIMILQSSTAKDEKVSEIIREFLYLLDTVFQIFNAQRFAFMVDLFLVRVACNLRIIVPEISIEPTKPCDEQVKEPSEFPPLPKYLMDFPQIKSKLDKMFEVSAGDADMKSILEEIVGDVNKVFKECIEETSLGDDSSVKDSFDRTRQLMDETKMLRTELANQSGKLQQLSQKESTAKQKELDQLESALARLRSVTDSCETIADKIRTCEADTARMKATRREYEAMKDRYLKALSEGEVVHTEGEKNETAGDDRAKIADPAVVEMSQQLTQLMEENAALRRQLNEVRGAKSGKSQGRQALNEQITKLNEKKELLQSEISSVKTEVLQEYEQKAVENDEKLFDAFDPIRIPLSEGKGFTKEVLEKVEQLVSLIFNAKQANDKVMSDAKKIESLKKKEENI